jgi:hypothetical protein
MLTRAISPGSEFHIKKIAEEDMQKAKGGKHIESGGWPVRAAKVLGMAASINFFLWGCSSNDELQPQIPAAKSGGT